MLRSASLLVILLCGTSLLLSAQRRDDSVEVSVADLQPTAVGVSVTLRAADASGSIHIMIGIPEARSIALAMHHEDPERPVSHDLFKAFLERNGWKVQKVVIRDVNQGTYLADLTLEKDHETQVYDARPSDAMAMGVRFGAKIYVTRRVFDEQRKSEGEGDEDQKKPDPETLRL